MHKVVGSEWKMVERKKISKLCLTAVTAQWILPPPTLLWSPNLVHRVRLYRRHQLENHILQGHKNHSASCLLEGRLPIGRRAPIGTALTPLLDTPPFPS